MNILRKAGFVGALALVFASVASATTFSNVVVSGSLSSGATFTTSGNSISFATPNAIVGDPALAPTRVGSLTMQYDALGGAAGGVNITEVTNHPLGAILGSGIVRFTEDIFELDAMGNEIGGPIGSLTQTFNASSTDWSGTIMLSHGVQNIRAKKSFTLLAPADDRQANLASLLLDNQNVVPEPASFAPLGIGVLVLLRRRRK